MKIWRGLLALILLAFYLFFPGRAVRLIAVFFLFVGISSLAWSASLKRSIGARRIVRDLRVSRFDRLELVVTVENAGFLPASWCFVTDAPGVLSVAAEDGRWVVSLMPGETVNLRYSIIGNARGEYAVGPLRLASGDPLGLFPFEKTIDDRCVVLVRPARVDVALAFDSGLPQGSIGVRDPRYEDVTLYRSVRDYAAGDELKRINWKASARFGRLFTNEYQASLNSPVFVFLDLLPQRYPLHLRGDLAESLIEIAAAIIRLAASRGQQCGFASTGTIPLTLVQAPARQNSADDRETDSDATESTKPWARIAAGQGGIILDLLARITFAEPTIGASPKDRDSKGHDGILVKTLSRALTALPSGGRLFFISPSPPIPLASSPFGFQRIADYVHEAKRA